MALPGYNVVVSIASAATGGGTYQVMDGNINFSLSDGDTMLDITDFADSRTRRRIAGLRDLSASLDGDLELTDTAYTIIKAKKAAGSPIGLKVLPDGTNGMCFSMLVESIERAASVDGKVTVKISLQHEGTTDPFDIGSGM